MGTVDAAGLLSEMAGRVENLTGCILARDGLILQTVPESQQTAIRGAWMRFSAIGGFEKGYLQFDGELWICVQRAPYELFVLARLGAKPGLILDLADDCLEQVERLLVSPESDQVVVLPPAQGEIAAPAAPASAAPVVPAPQTAPPQPVAAAQAQAAQPAEPASAEGDGGEPGTPVPRPVSWIVSSGGEGRRERPARSVSWIRVGNPEDTDDKQEDS